MKLTRLVLSDLHLGTGSRPGELNVLEDFHYDVEFAELLTYYDGEAGEDGEIELILNGDIFDLLKVQIDGVWPTEITAELAERKLRQCLDGHPVFVAALRNFLSRTNRRCVNGGRPICRAKSGRVSRIGRRQKCRAGCRRRSDSQSGCHAAMGSRRCRRGADGRSKTDERRSRREMGSRN